MYPRLGYFNQRRQEAKLRSAVELMMNGSQETLRLAQSVTGSPPDQEELTVVAATESTSQFSTGFAQSEASRSSGLLCPGLRLPLQKVDVETGRSKAASRPPPLRVPYVDSF